jgi:Sugar (and other) transporter
MAAAMLVSAAGLAFTDGTTRVVIVMIGLDVLIAAFAIGVGGTAWLIQGEAFPTALRGRAAAIAASVDWLAKLSVEEVTRIFEQQAQKGILRTGPGHLATAGSSPPGVRRPSG